MASVDGVSPLNAANSLANIYAHKENLTDAEVARLKELIPNLRQRVERAGSLNGHTVTTGGVGGSDKEIAILFLKTFHSQEAFIDHYLGLDTWGHRERAANPTNTVNINNAIVNIRETFMSNRTYLSLFGKGLTSLPEGIGKMVYLRSLDVCNNRLSSLPDSLGNLNLDRLDFSGNREMRAIPRCVPQIRTLTQLAASDCSITYLPQSINQLSNLRTLTVANNKLRGNEGQPLPSFQGMTSLEFLNLSYNRIESLPQDLGQHPRLTTINVSYNKLGLPQYTFPNLRRLQTLNLLFITGNSITERLYLPYRLSGEFHVVNHGQQISEEVGLEQL